MNDPGAGLVADYIQDTMLKEAGRQFGEASLTIVRELAQEGPFALIGSAGDFICTMCNTSSFEQPEEYFDDPATHEPSCLWRRAQEMYHDA